MISKYIGSLTSISDFTTISETVGNITSISLEKALPNSDPLISKSEVKIYAAKLHLNQPNLTLQKYLQHYQQVLILKTIMNVHI